MKNPILSRSGPASHRWKFFRAGSVDQVVLQDGQDICNLRNLDQKLWMALSMPTTGIAFDKRTLAHLDSDADNRLRPPELLAAVDWLCASVEDPGIILKSGDSLRLSDIKDPDLRESARFLLEAMGKGADSAIELNDVANRAEAFAKLPFNGDGIIPIAAAEDEQTRQAISDIIGAVGAATDAGGEPGLDSARLESFLTQATAWQAWQEGLDAAGKAAGLHDCAAATAAFMAVRDKIDDYFTRCRFAAFDSRAASLMNRDEAELKASAQGLLAPDSAELAGFPLAQVAPGAELPLAQGLNPVWQNRMAAFREFVLRPLLKNVPGALGEEQWAQVCQAMLGCQERYQSRPETGAAALGAARIHELIEGGCVQRIQDLIKRDEERARDRELIDRVEKLLLYRRDLGALLRNYVNFADFYGQQGAVFQAGVLYLDARACTLCIEVGDDGRHANLAVLSGAFLVYCDIQRPGSAKRKIAAVVSGGDDENLLVGRNGVFYDRDGQDWDATVTRILSAPISVRQAFWQPYKKLFRMIEEQIVKRAQTGEAEASKKLSQTAASVANVEKKAADAPPAAKKMDLGTIALIGTAIGGISALVTNFFQTLLGLGLWLPLGVVALILLISGPSMILASLKLRKRNLGPILDANGWAINTMARINIPFGATLTHTAALPPGTLPALNDPFAEKKKPWKAFLLLSLFAVLALAIALWMLGLFDPLLADGLQFSAIAQTVASWFRPRAQ